MSFLGLPLCLLNRHDPDRREVTWNGHDYVGQCRRCGVPIERVARRQWRKRIEKTEAQDGAAG